jgi:hypothetical protein
LSAAAVEDFVVEVLSAAVEPFEFDDSGVDDPFVELGDVLAPFEPRLSVT